MTPHSTRHGIVHTVYDPPPIPNWQRFAWSAMHEDYDGASSFAWGALGLGRTEQEAIADLLDQLDHE